MKEVKVEEEEGSQQLVRIPPMGSRVSYFGAWRIRLLYSCLYLIPFFLSFLPAFNASLLGFCRLALSG